MKSSKNDHWIDVVKAKDKMKPTVNSYPPELRGFAQNRFGGQQSQNLRTYGGKFGAAGPVRRLNSKERRAVEADLRQRGLIPMSAERAATSSVAHKELPTSLSSNRRKNVDKI